MNSDKNTNSLTSRIITTKDIPWRDLKFLQSETFKELNESDRQKLKTSLTSNAFIQPFYVWEDSDEVIYCLDGKHRTLILQELISEGVSVPDMLPAIFIDCKDKQEASKLVLIFSSAYAYVTEEGFKEFISAYDLGLPELLAEISIPGLLIDEPLPIPVDLDGDPKDKPATMKITFETYKQLEEAMPVIEELLKSKYQGAFFSVSFGEI